ncbi:MAG: methyltransferase regulatory domain-containing protein [Casimicrobiaceae bacterium]
MNDSLFPDDDAVTTGIRAAYDAIDYDCTSYPQSHPDRLNTVSQMFGIDAPPVATARVLEIGCGDGSNLIPVADAFPQATFVGIDLAPRAIDAGNALIATAELRNIELRVQDLRELPSSLGDFDYVIAHGFYSWVPPGVRDALMQLLATRLTPNGIGFVSFNTHPGNRVRQIASEAMHWHSRNSHGAADTLRAAREMLHMMAKPAPTQWKPDSALRAEFADRAERPDSALFHDDLAQPNDAFYFHEFAAHAARFGLGYVGDSEVRTMSGVGLLPEVREFTQRFDRLEREQYLDFMRLRRFRQSLLTRATSSSNFVIVPPMTLNMRIAAASTLMQSMDEAVQQGRARESVMQGGNAAINALLMWLASIFPATVDAREVARWRAAHTPADQRPLETILTGAYVGGVVDFFSQPPAAIAGVSSRPRASRIARLQAQSRTRVTNLRHESVKLADTFAHRLLPLLDGSRDKGTLQRALGPAFDRGAEGLDAMLQFFAKVSLLVA